MSKIITDLKYIIKKLIHNHPNVIDYTDGNDMIKIGKTGKKIVTNYCQLIMPWHAATESKLGVLLIT